VATTGCSTGTAAGLPVISESLLAMADSIFAMAECAAVGSTMPGISTIERSATSRAVASVEVRRSGRSMPAEKVTSMLSSEKDRSIRSPGP
jgi:hypothetical protein